MNLNTIKTLVISKSLYPAQNFPPIPTQQFNLLIPNISKIKFFYFCFAVLTLLGMEPRDLDMLSKYSTTELHHRNSKTRWLRIVTVTVHPTQGQIGPKGSHIFSYVNFPIYLAGNKISRDIFGCYNLGKKRRGPQSVQKLGILLTIL